jgi:hypothetical protein
MFFIKRSLISCSLSNAWLSPELVPYALLLPAERETPRSKSVAEVSNVLFIDEVVPYKLLLPDRDAEAFPRLTPRLCP